MYDVRPTTMPPEHSSALVDRVSFTVRPRPATRTRSAMTRVAIALGLCAMASLAHGQVYRCQDNSGKTTYADAPCGNGGKRIRLHDDAIAGGGNRTVCAQLQDEAHRLGTEVARDARRGKSSGAAAKRRQILVQYSRRCAGITRSRP